MSTTVKERLRTDLTAAMKARDDLRKSTLRMVLAAITTEEVSGAAARDLSDAEVLAVLAREVKKRKESAEAFDGGGRAELAEVTETVAAAVAEVEAATGAAPTMKQMGQVIKAAQARAAGRADGRRISEAVKAVLAR